MKARRQLALFGLAGLLAGAAGASDSLSNRPSAVQPQAPDRLSRLGWLAGCWERRSRQGAVTIEMWMPPGGNLMLGASRTVSGGAIREFEQLRLTSPDDTSVVYTALPSGQREASFRSTSVTDSGFTVENPSHDFPQRIIYRRRGADSLVARIEGPGQGGTTRGIDFPMRRVPCEADGR
jgi:hypothetical protein